MTFELDCYRLGALAVPLAPARSERAIFERNRHAYRCLPLSTANAAGWELRCPVGFTAEWDGGDGADAVKVTLDEPMPFPFAKSHFCYGILTFDTGWLFTTPQGYALWAMGPPNDPKDGLAPLAGIIETDWLPYSFTMNWQFTRPGRVRFEKDEPFCFLTPTMLPQLAACQPREMLIGENPDLQAKLGAWTADRAHFLQRLAEGDPEATRAPWRRHYFRARHPDGTSADAPDHINKLRLKAPAPSPALAQRGRLDGDGRLHPTPTTRVIRSSADASAAGVDFLVVDDFLDAGGCSALCSAYRQHSDQVKAVDGYWDGRLLTHDALRGVAPDAAAAMLNAVQRGAQMAADHYRARSPLYPDTADLTTWRPGMFMAVHADNAHPDGTPHPQAHRAYSGLVYLNDDFDGGGLYLPGLDVLIQPKRGMFVSLPAGARYAHGVVRVDRGERYTLPFFLTFDRAKAAAGLLAAASEPPPRLSFDNFGGTLTLAPRLGQVA